MKQKIIATILFCIGVASATLFILYYYKLPLGVTMALKIIPTAMMCVWMIIKRLTGTNWPIFVGLILSALCDAFMVFDGSFYLIGGIAANMLALVFYIIYFVRSDDSGDFVRLVPVALVLGAFYFILYDSLGSFKLPVLAYILLYTVFMWRASARLGDKTISLLSQYACFLGSVIITTSDCVLSLLIFGILPDKDKYHYLVLVFWWAGLYLLMITAEDKRKKMASSATSTGSGSRGDRR